VRQKEEPPKDLPKQETTTNHPQPVKIPDPSSVERELGESRRRRKRREV
jgi:hypothetical protein